MDTYDVYLYGCWHRIAKHARLHRHEQDDGLSVQTRCGLVRDVEEVFLRGARSPNDPRNRRSRQCSGCFPPDRESQPQ